MRWDCDLEGLEDNWCEVTERWSRNDLRAWFTPIEMPEQSDDDGDLWDQESEQLVLDRLKTYITEMHIVDFDGNTYDRKTLTVDALELLDFRIGAWLGRCINDTIARLQQPKKKTEQN